ncbi:ABC-three component system middle component 1 [Bacillus cereus]|uniref:ABC-three component system middle component 1 n=1 Tax=Bacillus cereus TaxID=1396 RepID=UPI003D16F78A
MNIHIITQRLKEKGFTPWDISKFKSLYNEVNEANLKIWKNDQRVLVIKNYSSKTYFQSWENDQISISYIYDILKPKEKNNLYFLLILDWEVQLNAPLVQFINMVEKDELICRKYVLFTSSDLERVPFLQDHIFSANEMFNYEQLFREQLYNQNSHTLMHEVINYYFSEEYSIDKETNTEEKEEKNIYKQKHKQKIYELISKE